MSKNSRTDAPATVLITGGRAPVALDVVRMLHAAGFRVVMAESLSAHISSYSRAVSKNYLAPWPNRDPAAYCQAIARIVKDEGVDVVLPMCEEIYFLSEGRDALPGDALWMVPAWKQLHALHSKWEFIQLAGKWNLPVPPTRLLTSQEELETAFKEACWKVFKPVYSRFARQAIVNPKSLEALCETAPSNDTPWVAQHYIAGQQLSTYSLAHEGKILAHVAYPMNFTTGIGPTYAYESVDQPEAFQWVQQFVAVENFSGQIAFDFIVQQDNSVVAIECNPRATSGLHLFRGRKDLARILVDPTRHQGEMLVPREGFRAQHALPLFLWALGYVRCWSELKRWLSMFVLGKDVLCSWTDPMPLLMLGPSLYPVFACSREHNTTLDHASTLDIEWNGNAAGLRSPSPQA